MSALERLGEVMMKANFYGGVDGEGQDGAAPGKEPPERGQTHHRKEGTLGQKDGVEG
jgi:hypothetical protein